MFAPGLVRVFNPLDPCFQPARSVFIQCFFGPCTPLGMYFEGHVHLFACTSGPCTPLGMYMRGRPFSKIPSPLIGNMHFWSPTTPRVTTPWKSPRFPPHFAWMHRFRAPRSTVLGHFCPTLARFRLVFAPLDCFRVIFAQRLAESA